MMLPYCLVLGVEHCGLRGVCGGCGTGISTDRLARGCCRSFAPPVPVLQCSSARSEMGVKIEQARR